MNPAMSIVFFTSAIGAAQGLVVFLALAELGSPGLRAPVLAAGLWIALAVLLAGLFASFFHLGHKLRAWRAVLMWRTSWMSREVIVLPAFIAVVGLWAVSVQLNASGLPRVWLPLAALAGAALLWWCTAMIYACLRFVQEWAHPLTVANYTLIGLASGLVLATVLMAEAGQPAEARLAARLALAFTLVAWLVRIASLRRNDRLRPKSDLQSATGLRGPRVVQTAMGMTGGSYNTREFFHGVPLLVLRQVRLGFQLLAFAVPAGLLALALATDAWAWVGLAVVVQFVGVLGERWYFFAQARHPQNLYYQVVS